jgi:hypothetical protein
LKDGVPHSAGIKLEPAWAIVRTYFEIAAGNVNRMAAEKDPKGRRSLGLQAFLMSLTGVEAFTNVFFLLLGRERNNGAVIKAAKKQAPLVKRLECLIELALDKALVDQEMILQRLRDLYQLRNQIVHPRWEPASMTLAGEIPMTFQNLSQNFQIAFEDVTLCREAYLWCLLLVARVGIATGNTGSGFCFFWAGVHDLREDVLLNELGL